MQIPFIRPKMPGQDALVDDLNEIIGANWYTNFGPKELKFRSMIEDYVGTGVSVVTVNNATSGLMVALAAALPRGNGTESIAIASFTFAAGPQAAVWHGYRPSWIDIDERTLQPSIQSFKALHAQDPHIKGILLTNTFGIGNPEIAEWESLAEERGLPLVIDSAAGFGSLYPGGELLGSRGLCEVFSFHATKPFAIGEGGAIVTRDKSLAGRIRDLTNFGFSTDRAANSFGFNAKLPELSAAIGIRQLATFAERLADRRSTIGRYLQIFGSMPVRVPSGFLASSGCFAPIIFESAQEREAAHDELKDRGVDARKYYSPLVHQQPAFTEFMKYGDLRVSESVAPLVLSLPILPDMAEEELLFIEDALRDSLTH